MTGPHPAPARLTTALAGLESAFGPRRDRIEPIDACDHCFDPGDVRVLAGPVQDIPDGLFLRAVSKWGTTMDANVPLWCRLTPRILRELTAQRLHIDQTLIARKFGEADWQDWPTQERTAVTELCEAWFQAALTEPHGPNAADAYRLTQLALPEDQRWR